jgi:pimeloyl-ACP methyl ester carboxylesterase
LEIIVNFMGEDSALSGAIDIPAQRAAGIPLYDIRYEPPTVHFEMLSGPQLAVFDGKMLPDGAIEGQFLQSGVEGTFELARPQEQAVEPLTYVEEEVSFGHGDVNLAGTLTLPEGDGPFPAAILLTGSGQQNRDEEIPIVPGYKPFRVIADHLTRHGIAVLRYDDRGVGGSTGDVANATTADFADDAEAALDYLLSRPEIDPEQIGLLGHSEGGMIAAMLAARRPDVAFAISMAGIAVSGYDTSIKQVERLALASGLSQQEAADAAALQKATLDLAVAQDWDALEAKITEIVTEQVESLPEERKAAIGDPQAVIQQQVAAQLQTIQSPWYQFFLTHNVADEWAQVTVPVLALFGAKDVQVDAEQNRAALEAALQKAGNDDLTVVVFPTANHLFQDAQSGAFEEYVTLAPEFLPGFLETISQWLVDRQPLEKP